MIRAAKLRTCGQMPDCCKDTKLGWGWQIIYRVMDIYLAYATHPIYHI